MPPGMEETLRKPKEKLRKGNGGMKAYLGNKEFWIRGKVNALNKNTAKYTVFYSPVAEGHKKQFLELGKNP